MSSKYKPFKRYVFAINHYKYYQDINLSLLKIEYYINRYQDISYEVINTYNLNRSIFRALLNIFHKSCVVTRMY